MPLVVPVMRYVVGVVVVEDILAKRKSCLGLDVVVVDVDGTVLDPVVGSAYACLPNREEGGMGSSLFCALVIFCFYPGYLLLLMPV